MHAYFNPGKFSRFVTKLFPLMSFLTVLFLGLGLYYALFLSPPDYQQGESVRIMYVHVPAAWMALGVYAFMAMASAASLIWKNPLSDILAQSAAPVGTAFTLICLITGALWGKPIWGAWWVWDARLTSMLILLFFYFGYMTIANAFDNADRAAKAAAIVSLVGFINVPIVKFSVDWWNTLHQPASILRSGGVAIDPSMLVPLLLMFAAFVCFFIVIVTIKLETHLIQRKVERSYRGFS